MNEFSITSRQALALMHVLQDHMDGGLVTFTLQGNGNLVVAFGLATIEIHVDGYTEEI